jgi:CDP-diacylglycerol---serine O-phosphatidyltransferase
MNIINLPNAITCGNLLCGCLGIIQVFEGDLKTASVYIILAGILDFFDGFVARLLHITSPVGKELDSLADCVTFGVLPSLILYKYIQIGSMDMETPRRYAVFVLTIFSALRLAKFNVDTRQSESFIGVPTPANALVVASLPLIIEFHPQYTMMITSNPWVLVGYCIVMSFLLVSELPLFALKFKHFKWKGNEIKFIFILLSIILLVAFNVLAVPFIVALYIILSLISKFVIS